MIGFDIYLSLILTLQVVDECWNCNNPRKYPKKKYIVCQWDDKDIFKDNKGNFHPYPEAKEDNYFERKARIKYWQKKHQGKE